MREAGPEVGPINVKLLLTWQVDVNAARAVNFDSRRAQFLGHTNGENLLALAKDSRTCAKGPVHVLLSHFVQTMRRENVASVDDAIQVHG